MRLRSIVFRVDASIEIGTGHLMRCLTLADSLRDKGAVCRFISRAHAGNLIELTRQRGYETFVLSDHEGSVVLIEGGGPMHSAWLGVDWSIDAQQTRDVLEALDVDWLIVDHYALEARWERAVASTCTRIMVIDDLADRKHECAVLLDQTLGRAPSDYFDLVPSDCKILVGVQYALLRNEFAQMRIQSLARRRIPKLGSILITMGGVDKNNATTEVLNALTACPLPSDCRIVVLMGPHAPWLDLVRSTAATMPFKTDVLVNVANVAKLMAESDLSIGAAGSTSWERCAVGLPTFMLTLAPNQRESAAALSAAGAVESFVLGTEFKRDLLYAFSRLNDDPKRLNDMVESSAKLCDGKGADRILSILLT